MPALRNGEISFLIFKCLVEFGIVNLQIFGHIGRINFYNGHIQS